MLQRPWAAVAEQIMDRIWAAQQGTPKLVLMEGRKLRGQTQY